LLALIAGAHGTACPSSTPGNPSNQVVYLGYRYNFALDKNMNDSVQLVVDSSVDISAYYLWLHASAEATTAYSAELYPVASVNAQAANSSAGLQFQPSGSASGSLTTGDVYMYLDLALLTYPNNGTNTIWITFFAAGTCNLCSKTIEFALELALLTSIPSALKAPTTFAMIPMQTNIRSFQWEASVGSFLYFFTTVGPTELTAKASLYSSVTTGTGCQATLYWKKGSPPTLNSTDAIYPDNRTSVTGNYPVQTPFATNGAGDYYLGLYLKAAASSLESTVTTTVKVQWNDFPCDSASAASVSVFTVLAMLALAWHL